MMQFGVVQFLFNLFGFVVTTWWIWVPLGAVLGFLAWQNYRRAKFALKTDYQLVSFVIPESVTDSAAAAEGLFASLHSILRPRKEILKDGVIQEHISFEMAVLSRQLFYFIWAPKHLLEFVQAQVAAHYPSAQLIPVANDYTNRQFPQTYGHSALLKLKSNDVLPITTYDEFESDSLGGVIAALHQLKNDEEEYWVQLLARPIDDSWHKRSAQAIIQLRNNKRLSAQPATILKSAIKAVRALTRPPQATHSSGPTSEKALTQISYIEQKAAKPGFEAKIRLAYLGNNQDVAEQRLEALATAFSGFTKPDSNRFKISARSFDTSAIREYRARYFAGKGFLLNTKELASIWHLPEHADPAVVERSNQQANATLPSLETAAEEEISLIGSVDGPQGAIQFGLLRDDRSKHVLVVGEQGSGKTGLMTLLALSDIYHHQGLLALDPQGDYCRAILSHLPSERAEQVIYFDLTVHDWAVAFNPIEIEAPEHKPAIVSAMTSTLLEICELKDSRSEYLIRYSLLALSDYPHGTLLDIEPLLTNVGFREKVISHITDPAVRSFWVAEYASWEKDFAAESTKELLGALSQVLDDPSLSRIMGQPQSSFKLSEVIKQGGVVLVNGGGSLSQPSSYRILATALLAHAGAVAESLMSTNHVRPFYVYVDSFEQTLPASLLFMLEEPHLPLNLTLATSAFRRLTEEIATVAQTATYTKILFTLHPDDATRVESALYDASDLRDLKKRHFTMQLGGHVVTNAKTLTVPPAQDDLSRSVVEHSQNVFATRREEIDNYLHIKRQTIDELKANTTEAPLQGSSLPDSTTVTPLLRPRAQPLITSGNQIEAAANELGHLKENEVVHIR